MKKSAQVMIGIFFIIATVSYLVGDNIILSHITHEDVNLPIHVGIFLEYINSFAVIAIAVLFFPFLNKKSSYVAVGYLLSRTIESTLLFVATIFPIIISQNIGEEKWVSIFTFAYKQTFQIGMLSLSMGSFIFCLWLYKFSTSPKWLSVLGIVGYMCLFSSCILSLVSIGVNIINYFYILGAIFEVTFPIYLIVKGLKMKNESHSLANVG